MRIFENGKIQHEINKYGLCSVVLGFFGKDPIVNIEPVGLVHLQNGRRSGEMR